MIFISFGNLWNVWRYLGVIRSYKSSNMNPNKNKYWTRKGPNCEYDTLNISMVIFDTDMPYTYEVMTSTEPLGTLGSVAFLLAASLYQGITEIMIGTTGSEISHQLREIYSICLYMCCWNVPTLQCSITHHIALNEVL